MAFGARQIYPNDLRPSVGIGVDLPFSGPTAFTPNYQTKDAIKNKDSKKLLEIFSSTKKIRKEIIKAGQDTDKPGFGRN